MCCTSGAAPHNLDPAATKGYPEYPNHLAAVGRVPCRLSADELVEFYSELLRETANFRNHPNEESRQRIEEIRSSLSGVLPLCETPVSTKQELYAQHGFQSTDVARFEERAPVVEQMLEVAAQVSRLKTKFMTLSDVNVIAEAAGVTCSTAVLSSRSGYTKNPRKFRHAVNVVVAADSIPCTRIE